MKNSKLKKAVSVTVACAVIAGNVTSLQTTAFAEEKSMTINIDGSKAITAENKLYRGLGMVSGNNSSRLLLDYKAENPDKYWEIMNYTFGANGIGITHLKLEMGSDINSSSGTEPSVMRAEDEAADVTRGAGFQLAADAKTINPDLTLDMLWWSEPAWVTAAADVNAARYKWYKETLDAAYETYGLVFDYVSANRNERAIDVEWTKYLAAQLDAETDCPYDYSAIKIVGGDGSSCWTIGDTMVRDEELLNAVDVIGGHYSDWTTDNVKQLAAENGKEVWFSEGCPPMSYSEGTYKYDGTGTGLTDINGMLDIANRIITMFPGGDMTLYEFQPVISAYYDGATYCQKQLITAETPWSGYYTLDGGYYMCLHFSQFFKRGWTFIDGACVADGKAGGDGHAIVDAVNSFMTACDTVSGDYSTVITNTTDNDIVYTIEASNLGKASSDVDVWETRGPDSGSYDENYFKKIDTITPTEKNGKYTYNVTVKPYSIVTVSTVAEAAESFVVPSAEDDTVLALPYADDFEYAGYAEDYLASRGGAPRYTTDEGGAFEVVSLDGNNVLMQKITPETKAQEWGGTPEPVTTFGDDSWFDYSVSTDVSFSASDNSAENYVGVGLRYCLAASGFSGYWFQLYEDGSWKFKRNKRIKLEGKLDDFDSTKWIKLRIEAVGNNVKAYVDGALIAEYDGTSLDKDTGESVTDGMLSAGRAALYSSYNQNCFDNVMIEAVGENNYVTRFDDTDDIAVYDGEWTHNTMSGFKNYNRTVSEGAVGATVELSFTGNGFAVLGATGADCVLAVELDGSPLESEFAVPRCAEREVSYYKYGLTSGEHKVKLTVVNGTFAFDALEVTGGNVLFATQKEEAPEVITEADNTTENPAAESADNTEPNDLTADNAADNGSENSSDGISPIIPIVIGAAVVAAAAVTVVAVKKRKK